MSLFLCVFSICFVDLVPQCDIPVWDVKRCCYIQALDALQGIGAQRVHTEVYISLWTQIRF